MTGIVELLEADGINIRKASSKEYHSPCPACGGNDRFVIWPDSGETGRAWCRQCNLAVDSIGYLKKIHDMTYQEAADHVGKVVQPFRQKDRIRKNTAIDLVPIVNPESDDMDIPSSLWSETAAQFITWAAENLNKNKEQLERLYRERGITKETAQRWRIGWNPTHLKRSGSMWGLEGEFCIPAGLVIPNIRDEYPVSVKIRRESGEPKYHLLRGSKVFPYLLLGDVRGTIAIVESEFDALLLWETARDVLTPIAGGGCSNHPDIVVLEFIAEAEIILDCLDNDTAGNSAGTWWKDWFPHCYRWKPTHKDPGEMYQSGQDVRRWIFEGIRRSLRDKGRWPGKLDFYEALDELGDPLPSELIKRFTEEQIERTSIMTENGMMENLRFNVSEMRPTIKLKAD